MATIDIEVPERAEEWLEDILWRYNIDLGGTYEFYSGQNAIWTLSGSEADLHDFLHDIFVLVSHAE